MDRSCDNTAQSHIVPKGTLTPAPEGFSDQQAKTPCICVRLILLVSETADQIGKSVPSTLAVIVCVSVYLYPGWGGFTPLHYAALHGNRVLVDLFLSNGADPNLTCDSGQTAFHFACRWAIVSPLYGVDETEVNHYGVITVCVFDSHQAREHLHHPPDDAVWSRSAPHRPAGKNVTASCSHWGQHVSANNQAQRMSLLFLYFFFVPPRSRTQITQILTLTVIDLIAPSVAVHYLWETGMFRFSDTDMYQVTPLHLAASTGNTEVVRYLLRDQVWYSPHSGRGHDLIVAIN